MPANAGTHVEPLYYTEFSNFWKCNFDIYAYSYIDQPRVLNFNIFVNYFTRSLRHRKQEHVCVSRRSLSSLKAQENNHSSHTRQRSFHCIFRYVPGTNHSITSCKYRTSKSRTPRLLQGGNDWPQAVRLQHCPPIPAALIREVFLGSTGVLGCSPLPVIAEVVSTQGSFSSLPRGLHFILIVCSH